MAHQRKVRRRSPDSQMEKTWILKIVLSSVHQLQINQLQNHLHLQSPQSRPSRRKISDVQVLWLSWMFEFGLIIHKMFITYKYSQRSFYNLANQRKIIIKFNKGDMVTFICEYCDLTLKKKQCDKHVMGRCRPATLICIDCSKTFRGNQYKNHISCISEMDKHWGQFAPSKKTNNHQNAKEQQIQENIQKTTPTEKTEQQQEAKYTNWKGWKNQIKRAVVEQSPEQKKVELQTLKKIVLKRYHEQFQETDKDEKLFMQKLQKLKKVKTVTYVSLE